MNMTQWVILGCGGLLFIAFLRIMTDKRKDHLFHQNKE